MKTIHLISAIRTMVLCLLALPGLSLAQGAQTRVSGLVTDAADGKALPNITIGVPGSHAGTSTGLDGRYALTLPAGATQLQFSFVGYQTVEKNVTMGTTLTLNIKMNAIATALNEVRIASGKKKAYHNRDNPAVELIRQVIAHKAENRAEQQAFLQYGQYERLRLSLTDLSDHFLNGRFFRNYRFLLDSSAGQKPVLPVFMSEKGAVVYQRTNPAANITELQTHKEVNLGALIDSAGLEIYMNRLYGDKLELYDNNIFVLNKQFLSPIADHAPDFYKFFITDTVRENGIQLINLAFTPRTKGDNLFEGQLQVTLDGHYAVRSADMGVNALINVNFLRSFRVRLNFEPQAGDHYYLSKSEVKADFGLFKHKGFGVSGLRTVIFSNYLSGKPMPDDFYKGPSQRAAPTGIMDRPGQGTALRPDTLPVAQARIYRDFDSLQRIPSYRRTVWLSKTLVGGYADVGPVQLGPDEALYAYNPVEGSRITLGGRTTPVFNEHIYLEGYAAYGTLDEKWKGYLSTAWSFNRLPYYHYPNDYIRVSYQYDTDIPGQNFLITKTQSPLASISRGRNDLWQYNRVLRLNYIRDFSNHISIDAGFKKWDQQPADLLVFRQAFPGALPLAGLKTTEANLTFRYAPHEKIFQGTMERHTIYSKYPIFTTQFNYGLKGLLGGQYQYLNASANIFKRFYLSQLGYTDITLLGGIVAGQAPFPLLAVLPANQTYLYNRNEYNMMNFLEFVADHYAGLNVTHSFDGFLLNKVPLLSHLQLREYLSFKILYGGLRQTNDPAHQLALFSLPVNSAGRPLTYALGAAPYMEIGVGIGNIFKLIRVEGIRRINYLDHPNVSQYGLRFSFTPDL